MTINDKRRFKNSKPGFTLTELLVVIGVMAVLAAIITPIISKTITRAYTAACSNNLRQLGAAVLLYINDHADRMFPYRDGESQQNGWNWLIMPYVGFNESHGTRKAYNLFICPVRSLKVNDPVHYLRFTYSINNTLVANDQNSPAPLINAIGNPHNVIFLGDSGQVPKWSGSSAYAFRWRHDPPPTDPNGVLSPLTDPDVDDNSEHGYFRYRHNELCNVVFLDGHVDSFERGKILNKNYYWPY